MTLAIANSIWVASGMTLAPEFVRRIADHFEAVLEVDEEGAEAAAATASVMMTGAPSPQFSLVVDRTFFCAISDQRTGAILFMGWILDPE